MMRKITMFFIAIMMVVAVNAQKSKYSGQMVPVKKKAPTVSQNSSKSDLLNESFESGIPAGWLNIDSDGDGNKWDTAMEHYNHSGSACATSASWNKTPLTPSNWLITPSISIPAEGNYVLEYWVGGQDPKYVAEHYKLMLSTTADGDTASFTEKLFEDTLEVGELAENYYIKQRVLLSPAYAGQTIRLAWVHFNCTDMYYINLDDIRIFEPVASDAQIVYAKLPEPGCALTAGTQVFIKVRNNGSSPITSLPVSFKKGVNGTPVTETITSTIEPGHDIFYTFIAGADFSAVGEMDSVRVWVDLAGDADHLNDTTGWVSTQNIAPFTIPYTLGFEATEDYRGLTLFDNNADGASWSIYSGNGAPVSGERAAGYKYTQFNDADDWIVTNCISLTPGNYAVAYYYKASNSDSEESLKVAYGTSKSVEGMTNVIADHPSVTSTQYQRGLAPFTITNAGLYYFGFQAYSKKDMYYLLLDDVRIDLNNQIPESANQLFLNAYPNPAKDQVVVNASATINSLKVYDVVGKQVIANVCDSQSVNVNTSNLKSGIYFVVVETALGVKTQKINIVR